ncbi:kinase-like protein [Canariomyces notabilis]|uniref:Kinase-like protein n=1 Tax=Canariomyces notabilis TaxID=2074819 RepID=A0AAN6QMH7_9PEZI|nr:kinase-like protein [Canariomyces arenarius]
MAGSMPSNLDNILFYLIPKNSEAELVVNCNPDYTCVVDGVRCLACYANRPSKIRGRLLSFGRHSANDICLPSGPSSRAGNNTSSGSRRGRSYQNYRNYHFFFFLAKSGELVIRDLSPGLTAIEVENVTADKANLYAFQGKNPRQRVIPRAAVGWYILFGTRTYFKFKWAPEYTELDNVTLRQTQDRLAAQALALHADGMTMTPPENEPPEPHAYHFPELRTRCTTRNGLSKLGHSKDIHKYELLGKGSLGRVSKAVDLASGEVWAVKEIVKETKGERENDRWRDILLREVNMLRLCHHENIVQLESCQILRSSLSYQLFFRLYKGNLYDLIYDDRCEISPTGAPPSYWNTLIQQMVSALEYLHGKEIIHRDIKPSNIMYDQTTDSAGPTFYLGDFGLSMTRDAISEELPGGGTPFYNAPELRERGHVSPASDIWALAVTLGETRRYWSCTDSETDTSFWSRRLAQFGCNMADYNEPESKAERWTHRILTFARHCSIPNIMAQMLSESPSNRPTAAELKLIPIERFSEFSFGMIVDREQVVEQWPVCTGLRKKARIATPPADTVTVMGAWESPDAPSTRIEASEHEIFDTVQQPSASRIGHTVSSRKRMLEEAGTTHQGSEKKRRLARASGVPGRAGRPAVSANTSEETPGEASAISNQAAFYTTPPPAFSFLPNVDWRDQGFEEPDGDGPLLGSSRE